MVSFAPTTFVVGDSFAPRQERSLTRVPVTVRIGVLAFRGAAQALKRWQPTADYLTQTLQGYAFVIVPETLRAMEDAVARAQVDFVLTNPGNYVDLESRFGVTRVATLLPRTGSSVGNVFGAVIFTRADRSDIKTIQDLRGKRFAAVKKSAFGGFQMAWREMKRNGINPLKDLSTLIFAGFPQDKAVMSVLSGEADAGTCRTGVLENLAAEGKIDLSKLRILAAKKQPGFPYLLSTALYPEWPFAQLKQTSQVLAQRVVIALLSMVPELRASQAGRYSGWTVPLNYQNVHELFKDLHIGPYGQPVRITFSDLVEQYWQWGVFAMILLGVTVVWGARVEHLVLKRTMELSQANDELELQIVERKRAEETALQRQNELAHISRLNTMGELAASLAHEINQPLAAVSNYTKGCVHRLRQGRMDKMELLGVLNRVAREAERAGEVIRRIRAMLRKSEPVVEPIDLNASVREAVEIMLQQARRQGVSIHMRLGSALPQVAGDRVQIRQVLLNLISNAMEAMSDDEGALRHIDIETHYDDADMMLVVVRDTGMGLPRSGEDALLQPFFTTKPDGMGMGLSISRTIVEACGGRLWIEQAKVRGAVARFVLPVVGERNQGGKTDVT